MLYTVSEMAAALGVPERTLRDWLEAGAPHDCEQNARIWIHGKEFAAWIAETRDPVKRRKLKDDEAYCMRCHRAVQMTDNPLFFSPKTRFARAIVCINVWLRIGLSR